MKERPPEGQSLLPLFEQDVQGQMPPDRGGKAELTAKEQEN